MTFCGPAAATGPCEAPAVFSTNHGNSWALRRRILVRAVQDCPEMPCRGRSLRQRPRPGHARRWPTPGRSTPGRFAAWCETPPRRGCSFFSAHRIVGPVLRQVDRAVEQALKARAAIAQMHADHAVVDLATTPQPLPRNARGMAAALGRPRFVNTTDRFGMSMFASNQYLAVVTHALLIPLDRFHEAL